jgi:hypothetical protein
MVGLKAQGLKMALLNEDEGRRWTAVRIPKTGKPKRNIKKRGRKERQKGSASERA